MAPFVPCSLSGNRLGPAGAAALAPAIAANGALTECNLQCDPCIGEEGEALIRKAMQGKAGFNLQYNPENGKEGEALIRKAVQGKAGFKLRI